LNPSTTTAGQTLPDLKVDIFDAFGNLTTTTTALTLTVSGPGTLAAGNTAAQPVAGVATFHGLMLTKAGSYTLSASATGLTPASTTAFTVTPAAPNQLVFGTLPTGGTAGQALPPITVSVLDAFGNLASSGPVTLTVQGTAVTATAPVTSGVATFNGLILPAGGSYLLSASATGLPTATSAALNVAAAPTSSLSTAPITAPITVAPTVVTLPPSSPSSVASSTPAVLQLTAAPVSGHVSKVLPAFSVRVLNRAHVAVRAGTRVTLKLVLGHHVTTVQGKTNAAGIVTFKGIKLTAAGTYTLTVSTPGLKTILTRHLTVLPG
jgi:hypothetical protein